MADEITTAAQLIDLAALREIVIHKLGASRNTEPDQQAADLPPDELRAPGNADEDAAIDFHTQLEGDTLGVRCRIETCNAYGSFVVDGEAIFDLPAPVAPDAAHIVAEFTEQVGAPTVFPYLRAAVATLAAQLAVPASPLPVLRPGDLEVAREEQPVAEEEPSELLMHGVVSRIADDGSQEAVAEFFVDEQTGRLTRIGGEGQTPHVDELLDAFAELPPPEELSLDWMIRRFGEETVRESFGEDAAAEVDEAVAHIASEDAFLALNDAINNLSTRLDAARASDETSLSALLQAAESVCDSWDLVRGATTE
ncbi:hypothetical protein [Mycolicibacterium fortuitum]|uniref:hypothetical protein n=1 Tax=Mycolicibacterium fortuitum TaxID=1766 RepID=UPI001CE19223|nr:hypothetical protein [Mycolicibacterium fortuitum]MCA4725797.1 hypothetical protein [Mycolicibacterium fortuitum]